MRCPASFRPNGVATSDANLVGPRLDGGRGGQHSLDIVVRVMAEGPQSRCLALLLLLLLHGCDHRSLPVQLFTEAAAEDSAASPGSATCSTGSRPEEDPVLVQGGTKDPSPASAHF